MENIADKGNSSKISESLPAIRELEVLLKELTSTALGRRSFLASIGVLLASCATTPDGDRNREGDNAGQDTQMTITDEKRMTQEVLPQMRKDYPTLINPTMQNYISNLGRKVASKSGLEGNPYNYTFTVVDVNYVNAFALPAGTVFVTAPLIAMADSEAELAGVVGHEIGHIKARHTAERMDKAKREESKSWKYALGGGILGGALGYGLGKLACAKGDDDCISKAAQLGAAAGVGGGLLIQKYGFMANSREDEMEADRVGFRTSVAAGFDKDHVGLFYEKLLKMEQSRGTSNSVLLSSVADAMSTHPPSAERVKQMNQMAAQQSKQGSPVVSSKEFDQVRKLAVELGKSKKA